MCDVAWERDQVILEMSNGVCGQKFKNNNPFT